MFHDLRTEFTFPCVHEAEWEACQNKPPCMLLGPPAETEKDDTCFSNENLNSQEQHLLSQHGKKPDFSGRVYKMLNPLYE